MKKLVKKFFLFGLVLSLLISTETVFAITIRVPGDYSTIQDGIDAASDGDTVMVADGTYKGIGNRNLLFKGKAITVRSENGPEKCIIDCERLGSGFYFNMPEQKNSVVSGFTIINGFNPYSEGGGGISCNNSSPTITNCIISGNEAGHRGGGISCYSYSSPTITNCIIIENDGGGRGGGIDCLSDSSPIITNCTISKNTTWNVGGGIYGFTRTSPTIKNCILWNNDFGEIVIYETLIPPIVTYCDVQGGYPGEGNINSNPNFIGSGNYHLTATSPCIDSGTSNGAPNHDIDGDSRPQGAAYDIGADEYIIPPIYAEFSASQTSRSAPLGVNFIDQSVGKVDSWNWSFGDGLTSNEKNPSHTYNDSGSYTVTLSVTGPEGSDTETKADYIKVRAAAMPWIPLLLLVD